MQWLVFPLLVAALTVEVFCFLNKGDTCTTTSVTFGTCKLVTECPKAVEIVGNDGLPQICGFEDLTAIVCCNDNLDDTPPTISAETRNSKSFKMCEQYAGAVKVKTQDPALAWRNEPSLLDQDECARQSVSELIVAGTRCHPKEFPHMARLGYGPKDDISWGCGGSLISPKFILTAGHCVSSVRSTDRPSEPVSWALLGDTDINSTADDEYRQLIRVSARTYHPDYKQPALYNDIMLLTLEKDAVFSPGVRPACIYDVNTDVSQATVATITGWGTIGAGLKQSDRLLKADLRLVDTVKCANAFKHLGRSRLSSGVNGTTMICAGDPNGKSDTCQGDSGGPLQYQLTEPYCMYGVVGVTSYGNTNCGVGNTPAIYTRVSFYRQWVEDIVWPN